MKIREKFLNARNRIDFFLRDRLQWGRTIARKAPTPERDQRLQKEFSEFFSLFDWKTLLAEFRDADPFVAADIGARNFAFAPVIDETLRRAGVDPEIHGIEIDAFRLLSGFHSRRNFGDYYASKIPNGYFHPMDFFHWSEPLHFALLLNPFVSEEPTLAWGLPLSTLKPEKMFRHVHDCLKLEGGLMLLTCPSEEELAIAKGLAKAAGFSPIVEKVWHPKSTPKNPSVQQKPRYGVLYRSKLS